MAHSFLQPDINDEELVNWVSTLRVTPTGPVYPDAATYRQLIEHIPAITYIAAFDEQSSTIYTSPQIASILGFSQDEWMADHTLWCERIHPDDRRKVLAELERIQAGGAPAPCEYRMLARDGRIVWFRDDVEIMRDAEGHPRYLYGVMLDITERKQVELELAEVRCRLAHSQEAERLRLARDLHDDAVQHLLAIGHMLDACQGQAAAGWTIDSQAVPHALALERIRHEIQMVARQLRVVISELRPIGLDDFGLNATLESYVARLRYETSPDAPAIALDMDSIQTPLPAADALCLFRVAQEALRNALTHARARKITLALRLRPDEIVLTVRDDGCGFYLPPTFSAFTMAGHVGLMGITERVAAVGGHLTIDTQPGSGTLVMVRIPHLCTDEVIDDDANSSPPRR